jgi:nucleotide-binding universal stress UspA family protein
MARDTKARVTLLHAVHLNLSPYGPADVASIRRELHQTAIAKISRVAASARQNDIFIDYDVREGSPCAVIQGFINKQDLDLVIIGRHQPTRWNRLWRQSTVDKVVHAAQCPVLVLPAELEKGNYHE